MSTTAGERSAVGYLARERTATALAVARRLRAGRTLWCASPDRPDLARAAADALQTSTTSARVLAWTAVVEALRAGAGPGDVVLLLAPADDVTAADLVRRAPAWGTTTAWLGSGDRPGDGAADHVLFTEDLDGDVEGLLRETGLLLRAGATALAPPPACDGPVCITCSDEGRLAEVLSVAGPVAQVRTAQGLEEADLTLVGSALPHDLLVVHAGTAITRLERQPR